MKGRSAVQVTAILLVALCLSGCYGGYLVTLVVGSTIEKSIVARVNAPTSYPPTGSTGTTVIWSVTDPPSRAMPGSSFEIRDAVLPLVAGLAEPSVTRYYLSLETNLPLRADKLLNGARAAFPEGKVTLTIPEDTPPGPYRLVACPRELGATDDPVAALGCFVSSGTMVVERSGLDVTGAAAPGRP